MMRANLPQEQMDRKGYNSRSRTILMIVVLGLAYFMTARLCLLFSLYNTNVSPIWFPSGIALAAIWVLGYRVWPGIFIGAFAANADMFLANHFGNLTIVGTLSYAIAIGNTLEAVAGCYFLRLLTKSAHPLASVDDLFKFFGVTLLVCLANALFGPTAVALSNKVPPGSFFKMWLTWWMGDTSGILTAAPFLFLINQYNHVKWRAARLVEAVLVFGLLVLINYGIFFSHFMNGRAYILLPLVVWSAYRFGVIGVSVSTLMTFGVAMAGTISGHGPFAQDELNGSLSMLSIFIGSVSITGLIIAAALKDRLWALDKASRNEQRFQSLVENSSDLISVISPDAVILYASPSTTKILGYEYGEYVGRNSFEFIHPDDKPKIVQLLGQIVMNPGLSVSGGCRYLHKNGSWRWMEGTGTNLVLDPAVGGIIVNYRDVTEKRFAQEDQLYLKAIVENSEDGIMAKSLDGIITSWNHAAEKIYGYTQEDVIGQPVTMLFPEDRMQEINQIMEDVRAGRRLNPMETVRRRKDGQLIHISLRVSPIRDNAGTLIGASAIIRDITERKKAELALRESEARFRNMADTAPVMIWVSGRDTLYLFCNKAWLDFVGRKLEQEVGSGWAESVHPDDRQKAMDLYLEAFDRRSRFTSEFRLRRWDGEYRWILNTGVPRMSGENKFEGFIGSCIDITEHRIAEDILKRDAEYLKKTVEERSQELDKMQAELKKANRLADLGTLAGTVAHELRNPLGVIQMAAFNLKRRHPELGEDKHIVNIEKKVWEGERIINNLLSYASIKVPRYEEIPVIKTLEDCVHGIQTRFTDANITVEKKYNVDPFLAIQADQLQLIEIFNNILLNAYQAFPEKNGTIELAVERHNGSVKILVKDSGMGIDEEDLEKVFVPFFTRKAKGTGLGLAICNELVHLQNGAIEIASEKGKGTTVTVDFPISQKADQHA